jgi:alpha-glucosidase
VLVACNTTPGPEWPAIAFPAGNWVKISLVAGDLEDPDLPDLYLREGAVLPLGPIMQHTGERPLDELELLVNPGPDGTATGRLYEDEGEGYAYREGGYRVTEFRFENGNLTSAVTEGVWEPGSWQVEVRNVSP